MPPDAILFDLDGTLVDSERDNVESVVLAMKRLGRDLNADERQFIIGHSWNEIYARLSHTHGLTLAMDALIALAVEEKRGLLASKGYTAMPGALETVGRFGRQCPMAVVSGSSRGEVLDAVGSLGLMAAFRFVMGAEDYSRGKPHPEPYAMAIERLGVRPGGCIVIEDATPGILSGRAAGARVIGVRAGNFSGYDLSQADVVVDTLHEVTDDLCGKLVAGLGAR